MCEITLNTIDLDTLDDYELLKISNTFNGSYNFHKEIYSPSCKFMTLNRSSAPIEHQLISDFKVKKAVEGTLRPMGKVSGEIGGKISWGGEDGIQASGYASGSASDDSGNKAEVSVEVNSDGSGSATVSVSHEERTDS